MLEFGVQGRRGESRGRGRRARRRAFASGSDRVGHENAGRDDDAGGTRGLCRRGIAARYSGMGRGRDASGVRIALARASRSELVFVRATLGERLQAVDDGVARGRHRVVRRAVSGFAGATGRFIRQR